MPSNTGDTSLLSALPPRSLMGTASSALANVGQNANAQVDAWLKNAHRKVAPEPFDLPTLPSLPVAVKELPMRVSVSIEKVVNIDTVAQTFGAEVYLKIIVQHGASSEDLKRRIEDRYFKSCGFLNASSIQEIDKKVLESGEDLVMVSQTKCTFEETMEHHAFPFDSQDLSILFTVYNENEGIMPVKIIPIMSDSVLNCRNFAPRNVWRLSTQMLDLKVKASSPAASISQTTYPVLKVTMRVERRSTYYLTNIVLPMLSFVLMSFTSYFVPRENAAGRLAVSLALVVTSAAYKMSVVHMLPAIGYNTMLDTFVMWCWLFLFLVVLENGLVSMSHVHEDVDPGAMLALLCSFELLCIVYALRIWKIMYNRKRYVRQQELAQQERAKSM